MYLPQFSKVNVNKSNTTNIQGNYFPRTILYPLNSKISSKIKWTNLKNCAPVFNITKKQIT